MKKALIIITIILGIVVAGVIAYWASWQHVGHFDLGNYTDIIAEFPSDKVLGPTVSAKEAKEKAEAVWIEIYGEEVKKEKPYRVSYDENTMTWLVQGYLPSYMIGGTAHILIQETDGKVLAVWHYK